MPSSGPSIIGHEAPTSAEGHVKGPPIGATEAQACGQRIACRHMLDLATLRRKCRDSAIHHGGGENVGLGIDREAFAPAEIERPSARSHTKAAALADLAG